MLRSVGIADYIQTNPATVLPGDSLLEAVQKILSHKISGLCVVDEQQRLVGMLSEMDCLKGILNATYNRTDTGLVSEYMTADVDVASPTDDIIKVATDMMNKKQRRRPVTENGKLLGQVSCRQLLSVVKDFSAA